MYTYLKNKFLIICKKADNIYHAIYFPRDEADRCEWELSPADSPAGDHHDHRRVGRLPAGRGHEHCLLQSSPLLSRLQSKQTLEESVHLSLWKKILFVER